MMKRKSLIVLSLLLIVMLAFSLTGCGKRTALTAEEFISRMEDADLTVEDVTDQFETGSVETVLIAYNDDYQIEFFIMPSTEKAETAFEVNKADFETYDGDNVITSEVNVGNYSYYAKTTADAYYVVSRIDASFIFSAEEKTDKDAVAAILKSLGY